MDRLSKPIYARLVCLFCCFASLLSVVGLAHSQSFPSKPVRIVVPFPSGTATDIYHLMGERMGALLGQSVIIDAKPGGGTVVGTLEVKRQPPDGYTLLLASNSSTIKSAAPSPAFDVVKDFSPVVLTTGGSLVFAVNTEQIKATTLREFVEYARQNPGKLNYASYGVGTLGHLAMELFKDETQINVVHVPLQGTAAATLSTVRGDTQVALNAIGAVRPMADSGKLRMLAVSTLERAPVAQDIPGMKEAGYARFDALAWGGFVVPAGTPRDVIAKLNAVTNSALKDPRLAEPLNRLGVWAMGGTPEQLADQILREAEAYRRIVRVQKIAID